MRTHARQRARNRLLSTRLNVKTILYIVVAVLAIAITYLVHSQVNLSGEGRAIEAGLIESGDRPAIYFTLRNTAEVDANYTYVVAYNLTEGPTVEKSSIAVPPGGVFRYALSLARPSYGAIVVNLRVHRGSEIRDDSLLYEQTWIVGAQA